ncbi:hypothetical protein GIB67_038837 [Kingdonia uniflora]|uniref:Uncharacterized protein n=1 Tax=Kingdonia uniflora TaxID=39325 RepID=A0A7J7M0W8_9MAGN|nr:hypothetical protein GIB67_038837 [Kingdonia uniflora]
MYGDATARVSEDDSIATERTAFRRAEKKYKLYIDNNKKRLKQPKPVDLSEVVDFKSILESYNNNGETPPGIVAVQSKLDRPIFCFEDRPGVETEKFIGYAWYAVYKIFDYLRLTDFD